jgi:HEAT repeat protein
MIDSIAPEKLRAVLAAQEGSERKKALDRLPPLTNRESLALVAGLLGDPSPAVCEAAISALARSGEPAVDHAVAHLDAPEPAERGYACAVLVRLGTSAMPAVIALLDGPDADKRKYAVDILAYMGDRLATQVLIKALGDKDVNVAAGAADALGVLGSADAVPALAAALARHSDWLHVAALGALGELGGSRALTTLGRISPASSGPVLAAAANAIGKVGAANPARSLAMLARILHVCAEQPLADAVICALGGILEGRMSWPPLAEATMEALLPVLRAGIWRASPNVRAAAVFCLGLTGELEAVRHVLDGHDDDPIVCRAALRVLASSNTFEPADEAACRRLLHGATDPVTHGVALRVLVNHDALDAPTLIAELCDEDGSRDFEDLPAVLRACGADHLVPVVRYSLTSGRPEVGRVVFRTLFPAEDAQKLSRSRGGKDVLRIAAAHVDWQTRAHAISLLGEAHARWGRAIILRACDDPEARVRVRAIKALAQCAFPELKGDLVRRHLADASGWVRVAAVEALGGGSCLDETQLLAALGDDFVPVAVAGARAAVVLCERGSGVFTEQVQTALARVAATDYGREDPVVAQWHCQLGGV